MKNYSKKEKSVNETMNLKESKEGCMGGLWGKEDTM